MATKLKKTGRLVTSLPNKLTSAPVTQQGLRAEANKPTNAASAIKSHIVGAATTPGTAATTPFAGDAAYVNALGQLAYTKDSSIAGLQQQQAYSDTDHAESLRRVREQQSQALQNTREGANREGLFYSGQLGKRQGDVSTQYQRMQDDMVRDYERAKAANAAAIAAAQKQFELESQAAYGEAVNRQTVRDSEAAAANALAPASAPATLAPTAKTKLAGPRGEKPFLTNGKLYYRRASDGKAIPL